MQTSKKTLKLIIHITDKNAVRALLAAAAWYATKPERIVQGEVNEIWRQQAATLTTQFPD